MRCRNVKPRFFSNERLAECDPLARLLFIGLWCLADRDGRLEDRPKRIRAEVLPYDDGNVDTLLGQLAAAGFIARYEVDGRKLIQVNEFAKHQKPHPREQSEGYPAPQVPSPEKVRPSRTKIRPGREKALPSREKVQTSPASYFLLNDDIRNPSSDAPSEHMRSDRSAYTSAEGFKRFWKSYPRKVDKEKAVKAWAKLSLDAEDAEVILAALKKQKQSQGWTESGGKYIPYPATWLNGKRWEDEVQPNGNNERLSDGEPLAVTSMERLREIGYFDSPNGADPNGGEV
jgi:hypothetical protein